MAVGGLAAACPGGARGVRFDARGQRSQSGMNSAMQRWQGAPVACSYAPVGRDPSF